MFKLFTNFTILEIIKKNIIFLKMILPRIKKKTKQKKRNVLGFYLTCYKAHWRLDIGIAFPAVTALAMSSFCDYINFSIAIQPRFTIYGLPFDYGG